MKEKEEFTKQPLLPKRSYENTEVVLALYKYRSSKGKQILMFLFPKIFVPQPITDEMFKEGKEVMVYCTSPCENGGDRFVIGIITRINVNYFNYQDKDNENCGGGTLRSYAFVPNKRFF